MPGATQKIESLRTEARSALESNDLDTAIDAYSELLKLAPKDQEASEQFGLLAAERTQALLKAADRDLKNKRFEAARESLHRCLQIDPNHKLAKQKLRTLIKLEKSRKTGAIVWAAIGLVVLGALTYGGLWVWNALTFDEAKNLLVEGQFDQAVETLKKVGRTGIKASELSIYKEFAEHMVSTEAAFADNFYRKAAFHIDKAGSLLPEHPQIQTQLDDLRSRQEAWLTARLKEGDEQTARNEFDVCRKTLATIREKGTSETGKDGRVVNLESKNTVNEHVYNAERLLRERELLEAWGEARQALDLDPKNDRALVVKRETKMSRISLVKTVERPHSEPVSAIGFSGDGKYIGTTGQDGHLRIWDAANFGKVKELKIAQGDVFCVAFSPDGRLVAAASFRDIQVFQMASYSLATNLPGHDQSRPVRAVAFSSDGKFFASGSAQMVRLFNTSGFSMVGQAASHKGQVVSVSISKGNRYVASAGFSEDRTVRIYDAASLSSELKLIDIKDDDQVSAVAFSPDGRYLAYSTVNGRVWVHEGSGGFEVIKSGRDWDQREAITSIAFSSDGKFLVTATSHGTLRVWEMDKFKKVWEMKKAHRQEINCVAISPTSFVIATGGFDEMKIWRPEE
jgi:tetratricopeptide (TPR) repeat protein